MSLKDVLSYASFIPWILYFIEIMLYRIGIVETYELNQNKYLQHINKHLFSSINIKELLLFSIFLIFLQNKNETVLMILFPTIYLYLLIDFFYGLANDCKKIKYKSLMVQSVLVVVLIVSLFILKIIELNTAYILMFISSIFSAFLMFIFCSITKTLRGDK